MLNREPGKNRCVLIIRIGGLNDDAYDPKQWNADPSKLTLAGLPSIVRPLIDGLTNPLPGQKNEISLRADSEYYDSFERKTKIGLVARPSLCINEKEYHSNLYDYHVTEEQIKNKDLLDEYQRLVVGRPDTYMAAPICLITIELAMNAEQLADAINNGKAIDQALIKNIYTSKTAGQKKATYHDIDERYGRDVCLLPKELIFAEIAELNQHLAQYKAHLESQSSTQLLEQKLKVVDGMIKIMDDDKIFYQHRIAAVSDYLKEECAPGQTNGDILKEHRDNLAIRILVCIGHALTLGLVSKLTKHSFCFWKTYGETISDEVSENIAHKQGRTEPRP